MAEESEVGDSEEMGFLRWVVWSEGRRSTMSGYHEMVPVCVQLRAASGGRVDWSSAEMAESGRFKGGEVGPWYLPDCGADWSFWHLEEWRKDEGKNRWAFTPLWRIRCLRGSTIDSVRSELPLLDDPRLILCLTFSNSCHQKKLDFKCSLSQWTYWDGNLCPESALRCCCWIFFLPHLSGEAFLPICDRKQQRFWHCCLPIHSKTLPAWQETFVSTSESCSFCTSVFQWLLSAQTGDVTCMSATSMDALSANWGK